jgi:hypothetical protein
MKKQLITPLLVLLLILCPLEANAEKSVSIPRQDSTELQFQATYSLR